MNIKKNKQQTLEEVLEKDISNYRIMAKVYQNPTRVFSACEEVIFGNWEKATIEEVYDNGIFYRVKLFSSKEYIKRNKPQYKGKGNESAIRIIPWLGILKKGVEKASEFKSKDRLQFNSMNIQIDSVLHFYYYSGINMDPEYQRDYVWSLEDKQALIDSIFNGIEIGKMALIRYSTEQWLATNFRFEVLDGKQRINALREFYEDRFSYKGKYFSEMSDRDRWFFRNYSITLIETDDVDREKKLDYFLRLNTFGRVMDKKHLNKIKNLLIKAEN